MSYFHISQYSSLIIHNLHHIALIIIIIIIILLYLLGQNAHVQLILLYSLIQFFLFNLYFIFHYFLGEYIGFSIALVKCFSNIYGSHSINNVKIFIRGHLCLCIPLSLLWGLLNFAQFDWISNGFGLRYIIFDTIIVLILWCFSWKCISPNDR